MALTSSHRNLALRKWSIDFCPLLLDVSDYLPNILIREGALPALSYKLKELASLCLDKLSDIQLADAHHW